MLPRKSAHISFSQKYGCGLTPPIIHVRGMCYCYGTRTSTYISHQPICTNQRFQQRLQTHSLKAPAVCIYVVCGFVLEHAVCLYICIGACCLFVCLWVCIGACCWLFVGLSWSTGCWIFCGRCQWTNTDSLGDNCNSRTTSSPSLTPLCLFVCLSVCLYVCLSVCQMDEKRQSTFHAIFESNECL